MERYRWAEEESPINNCLLAVIVSIQLSSWSSIRRWYCSIPVDNLNYLQCLYISLSVTGGHDHYVRLWNPYVTAKATSVSLRQLSSLTHKMTALSHYLSLWISQVLPLWSVSPGMLVHITPTQTPVTSSVGHYHINTAHFLLSGCPSSLICLGLRFVVWTIVWCIFFHMCYSWVEVRATRHRQRI